MQGCYRICHNRSRILASGVAVGSMCLWPNHPLEADSSGLSERKHLISATFNANSPTEDRNFTYTHKDWSVGGILDGHGGWQVADFACNNFVNVLMPRVVHLTPTDEKSITASLERAFSDIEKSYIDSVRNTYRLGFREVGKVGACALLALRSGQDLYIANCGDCRAVLGSTLAPFKGVAGQASQDSSGGRGAVGRYTSTRLSRDHNARTPLEALLLREAHPGEDDIIKCKNPHACYVKGRLQLTRALGDLYLKFAEFNTPKTGSKSGGRHIPAPYSPPYVSSQPEINHVELDKRDQFLILASDGVWDFLSDQEAVEVVAASVAKHDGCTEHAAQDLVEATLARAAELNNMSLVELKAVKEGSERRKRYDDTTAVVMFFDNK